MVFARFFLSLSLFILTGFVPAPAQEADMFSRDELEVLEAEVATARRELELLQGTENTVKGDVDDLDAALEQAEFESRQHEEDATKAERELIDLDIRRRLAREALYSDEAALEDLLATLMLTARQQPPALIISPDEIHQSIRKIILMGDTAPKLAEQARRLAEEITELDALEERINTQQIRFETAESQLSEKRQTIEKLAIAKRLQYRDAASESRRIQTRLADLEARAQALRQLLAELEARAPPSPSPKPARIEQIALRATLIPPQPTNLRPLGPTALGAMTRPVAGRVFEAFGARRETGSTAEGITIITDQSANVIAPVDGVVEFSDAFRSYGQMLIIRTSDDYRVIMTGLGTIYTKRGQRVRAGETVGRMSARQNPPPELYLELRKEDRSEDPAKWLGN